MHDYFEDAETRFLAYIKEWEPDYRKVLILDQDTADDRGEHVYPKKSYIPLFEASLCFYVIPNGGLRCLKDKYDFYGRDNIFFGL